MALAGLLVAASFLSGVSFDAAGLHVRPEQVIAPLVALAAVVRPAHGRVPRVALLALVFLAAGLFGAFAEPDAARAALHTARLLATLLPVALLPLLLDRVEAERAWDFFLACAAAAAGLALLALAAHARLGTAWGVTVQERLGYVHPQGTLLEPNVLGALSAAAAVAFLLRLLDRVSTPSARIAAAGGFALTAAATAASMTRAAWLALPFAAGLVLLLASGRRVRRRALAASAAVAVAALAAVAAAAILLPSPEGRAWREARTGIAGKLASLAHPAEDPNVVVRLRSYEAALAIFRERPLLGAGHGAMERLPGTEDARLAWAGNLEVHLLADTGLTGLLAVSLLCAAVLAASARRKTRRALERTGALVVLLLCAQATETSWLASFWVLLGLALAADAPDERPKRTRVLFVHPSDELYGSDRVLLELVARLPRARVEPLVLLSSDVAYAGRLSARLAALGVPVRRFRLGVLRRRAVATPLAAARLVFDAAASTLRVAALVLRERIDVVHANTVTVLPAALGARLAGRPLVWHVHEIVPKRRLRGALLRLVDLLATRVVTVSEAARAALGPAAERAEVIPNGIEIPAASPVDPESPPYVLFLGRLAERKGPDVLLEAVGLLAAKHRRLRCVFAGDEFAGSVATRGALERRADALGLHARVTFLPFLDDIAPLLRGAAVVAAPSRLPESFGLSVLEAMGSGKAVVATALGGPAELIADGESGLLVPPGDAPALARALDALLSDGARARALGAAARERARLFSPARGAARFLSIYEEEAGRTAATAAAAAPATATPVP